MKRKWIAAALVMACGWMLSGCGADEDKQDTTVTEVQTEAETKEETEAETSEPATDTSDATSADATSADASPADATSADAQELEKPEYDALDYVELGKYKGLEITIDPIQVTDEEIDAEIQSAIVRSGNREELKEGTAENGDIAVIDYVGTKDEVEFEGGTSKDYELELGSNTFIEGFEDGIIGMEVGETKDLNLTFPESYPSEDLAGADVVFTVTLNAIKRIPELNDELVQELSDNSETVEEYREEIAQALEENKKLQQRNTELQQIYALVLQGSVIKEYPQELIDYNVQQIENTYITTAKQYGMELEEFMQLLMGMTIEQFEEQAISAAESSVRQEMLLKAIAETEGIEISEEEYQEGLEEYTSEYGFASTEAFLEINSEEVVRNALLQDKVMQFLLDNAEITEATASEATISDATDADADSVETETETE